MFSPLWRLGRPLTLFSFPLEVTWLLESSCFLFVLFVCFPCPFSESLVFLICHDDVPWCGVFVVVHGAGQCVCVETGHSYPSVLIFLIIFFFFVVNKSFRLLF